MNYVAITFLVLVVFFLLANKKLIPYEEIIKNNNLRRDVEQVRKNIIYINREQVETIEEIETRLSKTNFKYVVYGEINDLNEEQVNVLIANFVNANKKTCGMGYQFEYISKEKRIKTLIYKLLVACLNYIEMLSRHDKLNYSLIIAETNKLVQDIKSNNIVSFTLTPLLARKVEKEDLKESILKKHQISLRNTISILLTIIAGTVVTANIIYNLINVIHLQGSVYNVIACALIYICYANITVEIYKPMGIFRFVASYLFPLYIVVFVIFTAYYYIKEIMLRCNMSSKKSFFISLVILFIVYLIFILIKR